MGLQQVLKGLVSSFLFLKDRSKETPFRFITFDSLIVFVLAILLRDQTTMWSYGVWSTYLPEALLGPFVQ